MKFTLAATLTALVTASFAQNIAIGFPANYTCVTAGSSLIVEVDRPDSLTGSEEVAVVIGIRSCGTTPCLAAGLSFGLILYNGGYNPQFQQPEPPFKPPHQNFTVTIPSTFPKATAQLSVFHVTLIGAGLEPFTETKTLILDVV